MFGFSWEMVAGLIRHGLTVAAGWLVSNGVIMESQIETFVGAALALAGIAWSVWAKRIKE